MAIVRQTASAPVFHNTISTNITLNKPTGVTNGDVLLAVFNINGATISITTVPTGWVLLGSNQDTTNGINLFAYTKVISNAVGEPTTYVWNPSSTTQAWGGAIARYSGVDNTTVADAAAVNATGTNSTTMTAAAITTVTDNAKIVTIVGQNLGVATYTPPGTMAEWMDNGQTNATASMAVASGDGTQITHGLSSTFAWTSSVKGVQRAITAVLRPVVAAAPQNRPPQSLRPHALPGPLAPGMFPR